MIERHSFSNHNLQSYWQSARILVEQSTIDATSSSQGLTSRKYLLVYPYLLLDWKNYYPTNYYLTWYIQNTEY